MCWTNLSQQRALNEDNDFIKKGDVTKSYSGSTVIGVNILPASA